MRTSVKSYDAHSPTGRLGLFTFDRRSPRADAVVTEILIIDTAPCRQGANPCVPTLATNGTIMMVGDLGPLEPPLNTGPMAFTGKTLAGSLIGGIAETQEKLDFCGQRGITSDIKRIRIQDVNEAYERMLKTDVKYRCVVDAASLKSEVAA